MSPACEIVLLVYDKLEYTRPCVESILARTDVPFHLTIVDNGSAQPQTLSYLESVVKANPRLVRVLRLHPNRGYVAGVNSGLAAVFAAAGGPEFCCVISNDTLVFPGWLNEMLAAAHADQSIGLVNPQWEFPRERGKDPARHAGRLYRRFRGRSIEMDWCRGFCFLLRRSLYEKIGGLDQAFAPGYFDDWDYSIRAVKAGFRCMLAQGAFVRHYINATFASQLGQAGVSSLFEERRQMFYRRWGRQLNLLMVFQRCDQPRQIETAREAAAGLLRGQDHLYLITDAPRMLIRHTNCFLKKTLFGLVFLRAAVNILNNLRYQKSKRYAMIICSEKMKAVLEGCGLLRDYRTVFTFESIAADTAGFWRCVDEIKFQING